MEVDDNGFIYLEPGQPYPLEELADEVDETPESLRSLLQTMEDLGMILVNDHGIQFLSYAERQFKSDSDGASGTTSPTSEGCRVGRNVTRICRICHL